MNRWHIVYAFGVPVIMGCGTRNTLALVVPRTVHKGQVAAHVLCAWLVRVDVELWVGGGVWARTPSCTRAPHCSMSVGVA